ncbi:prephenate dehydrogenase/arogenate dehydrogenase family protein [Halioglobus maricola]|uniref:prephenate dehydrogenase n=1 Tax=Halioglobus maricola TaxID=2601894 RepID=A0A5P9NIF6_9GAMM|nr:prephenate dehydrogenase/arogenate dehydrogenase family protein [Halioglobus maricola]QFU75329.1 prephenate dehydrogenase/arogenate dehydrogenase family protein [Halioglobus maricola]
MATRVSTVAILGLGLIGGSLARALKANAFCERVIGYGHRAPSLEKGVALGVIDSFTLDLDEVIESADILVICTPTLIAEQVLEQILPRIAGRQDAPVVTDAASVKGNLESAARRICDGRYPANFVLGHPIAGSEQSGVAASKADLYVNHRVIITPVAENDAAALDLVRDMWAATGAEVVDMSVAQHDAVLAATSHLPHVLAYSLVDALAQSDASDEIFRCAAGGFRDFTRIASSDPVMWRDIAIANKGALLDSIDLFSEHLASLRAAVEAQDSDGMHATFTRAKAARDEFAAILAERQGDKAES